MTKLLFLTALYLSVLQVRSQGISDTLVNGYPRDHSANQSSKVNNYMQLVFEHGGILPVDDDPKVNDLLKNSTFRGISLRYGWELRPFSVYRSVYRRPLLGVGLMATTFKNPVIGAPISVYGFVEIPFSRQVSRLNFTYGLALGLSFNFNPYDTLKNPQNLMISSQYNAYLHASIQGRYQLSKYWQLGLGIGYKHFSNGATKKPNAGINLIPIQVSAQYKLSNTINEKLITPSAFKPYLSFSLYTSSGVRQNNPGEELIYKNLTGVFLGYQFSYKYKIGLGFDLTYSSGGTRRVANASAFSSNFSYGIYSGWEWNITDRLYIPINVGVYLHRNIENSEIMFLYERIGLRYLFFNRHFTVGPSLKIHAGTADFIEFNLGWIFHRNKNIYREY